MCRGFLFHDWARVFAAFCLLALGAGLAPPAGAQDFSDYKLLKVSTGHVFTEGPAWSPDGYLIFSDVPRAEIRKIAVDQKSSILFVKSSNGANGNAYDTKGRRYTCESFTRRLVRVNRKRRTEVLIDKWEGKRLNAPNDVIVRRDGHIYFTDPAFGKQADGRELDFYGVYHLTPKGAAEIIARPKGRPNGIGLSPNGKILYVANTDERRLYAYDLDKKGRASNDRVLIDGIDGPPDGIAVDEKGNIYIAANQLPVYNAAGKLLHTVQLGEQPANCAFGAADGGTLYITARTSVYAVRFGVKGAFQY